MCSTPALNIASLVLLPILHLEVLEHLEQVAHLSGFRRRLEAVGAAYANCISTYKVGETLAHIFYLEKAPKCAKKAPEPSAQVYRNSWDTLEVEVY